MSRKQNRNMILLFLVIITIVSLAFGYIYGMDMNTVSYVDQNDVEGFGEFEYVANFQLYNDFRLEYKFRSGDNDSNLGKSKNKDKINHEKVLKGVSSEIPLYQIRFPKNAIRFKPVYMKIEMNGLNIESLSDQGEISVSLYEHKEAKTIDDLSYPNYDYDSGYSHNKKRDSDMINFKNAFIRKKIYSKKFCESKNTDDCGKNTNLKGDTYVIELNKDELPSNTVIGNKHVIMIGGNSSIKYENVNITIIGDYENVEQVYHVDRKLLDKMRINGSYYRNKNSNTSDYSTGFGDHSFTRKIFDNRSIYVNKIKTKNEVESWNQSRGGYCLDINHVVTFKIKYSDYKYSIGKYNISATYKNSKDRYSSKCHDLLKRGEYTINVNNVEIKDGGDIVFSIQFNNSGGNDHQQIVKHEYLEIYYTLKKPKGNAKTIK